LDGAAGFQVHDSGLFWAAVAFVGVVMSSDGLDSAAVSVIKDRIVVFRRRLSLLALMAVPLAGTAALIGVRISARGSGPGFVWVLGVMFVLFMFLVVVWWLTYRRAMGGVGQPSVRRDCGLVCVSGVVRSGPWRDVAGREGLPL